MHDELNNLLDEPGIEQTSEGIPFGNTEKDALVWAESLHHSTRPGHGVFLELSHTPEFEKIFIHIMTHCFGWIMEVENYFVRKPEVA